MHEGKPGETLYIHEDGSVHKVRILQDLSTREYLGYKLEVLAVVKPLPFSGGAHPVGYVFDVLAHRDAPEYAGWKFKPCFDA